MLAVLVDSMVTVASQLPLAPCWSGGWGRRFFTIAAVPYSRKEASRHSRIEKPGAIVCEKVPREGVSGTDPH
jgi:hypothetical protein